MALREHAVVTKDPYSIPSADLGQLTAAHHYRQHPKHLHSHTHAHTWLYIV